MTVFDKSMLAKARASIKQAFVPMPGGQGEPVAGASQMTAALPGAPQDPAAMGVPMDPAMMGGMPPGAPMDPAAMGAPMDPAAMGGAPVDPAAGAPAGDPMAGMDPAMMEQLMGGQAGPTADGNITMPVSQLLQLIQTLIGQAVSTSGAEAGKPADGAPKKKEGTSSKIDAIYQALSQQGIIAPASPDAGQPQV